MVKEKKLRDRIEKIGVVSTPYLTSSGFQPSWELGADASRFML